MIKSWKDIKVIFFYMQNFLKLLSLVQQDITILFIKLIFIW